MKNSTQNIGQKLIADDFLVDDDNRVNIFSLPVGSVYIPGTEGHPLTLDFRAESNQHDMTRQSLSNNTTNHTELNAMVATLHQKDCSNSCFRFALEMF